MITNKGTQVIQTKGLTLRRFTEEDAQAMFDTWANDQRVTRYLTWTPHGSVELTQQLLKMWCEAYEKTNYYNWAIELQGKLIGNISVVLLDERSERAELGYCMGFQFWNKGIMTEAVRAVMDFMFAEVGVNRVEIWHAVKNPASGKVAQKCGLTSEGIRRQFFKSADGEYLDIAQYAILRSEWKDGRK